MQEKRITTDEKQGLSGWLSTEGIFTPASYGKYDEVARKLEKYNNVEPICDNIIYYKVIHGERLLELSGYIKFTFIQIRENVSRSYVYFPQQIGFSKDITGEQLDWLESNYNQMSAEQEEHVRFYLHHFYYRK